MINEPNQDYLSEHFLTIDEVAVKTGISVEVLNEMILVGLLPKASYKISTIVMIESRLFEPELISKQEYSYFPKAFLAMVTHALALQETHGSPAKASQEWHREFNERYKLEIVRRRRAKKILPEGSSWDRSDALDTKSNETFDHWAQGTYGMCVRASNDIEAIVAKQSAVAHMEMVQDETITSDAWLHAMAEFDAVVMPFAPFERARTSRGRLVDSKTNS